MWKGLFSIIIVFVLASGANANPLNNFLKETSSFFKDFGGDLDRLIEKLKKIFSEAIVLTPSPSQKPVSVDCQSMIQSSPKKTVAENIGSTVIKTVATTTIIWTALRDNKKKAFMEGLLAGVVAGAILGKLENNDKIATKSRKDLLTSNTPPYFKITKVYIRNKNESKEERLFKPGDYVALFIRTEGLNEDEKSDLAVKYIFKLYRNGKFLGSFSEDIHLPQGESVDYMYIPVCKDTEPGIYRLELLAVSNGIVDMKEIEWEVATVDKI